MVGSVVIRSDGLLGVAVGGAAVSGEMAEVLCVDRLVALQHANRLINLEPLPLAACQGRRHCLG